jgi:hypothetical protein
MRRSPHAVLAFANNTAASNANGSTSSGDVAQIIDIDQISSITSTISKNNSGDINAAQPGIFAEINNGLIGGFANNAVASNANGTAAPITFGDVTQSVALTQTNSITSTIEIVNSGDIDAGLGILAEINNQAIGGFANSAAASNANGSAFAANFGDLVQSTDFTQTNSIGSNIAINQSGDLTNGSGGIYAEIDNQAIGASPTVEFCHRMQTAMSQPSRWRI